VYLEDKKKKLLSASARCAKAANDICRFLNIFSKNMVYFENTFSTRESNRLFADGTLIRELK
jgi:hypothetical protein